MATTQYHAHFVGDLYSDDSTSDFGPFATDEGADIFAEWEDRATDLAKTARVRDVLADDVADVDEFIAALPDADPGIDAIVIGAAFTVMRLTGQLDPEGRRLVLDAIARSRAFYGSSNADLEQMARDVADFTPES